MTDKEDAGVSPLLKENKFHFAEKDKADIFRGIPVTWLNTIWLNFFVESFGLKILSQVTTKLSQLHSNSRNKYVNSRKYHNVGHMRCMHARPHRRKDQLPLRSLRDLRGWAEVGRRNRIENQELVLRSTYQIFEGDRNNSDRNFYNVVRDVHIPLVP